MYIYARGWIRQLTRIDWVRARARSPIGFAPMDNSRSIPPRRDDHHHCSKATWFSRRRRRPTTSSFEAQHRALGAHIKLCRPLGVARTNPLCVLGYMYLVLGYIYIYIAISANKPQRHTPLTHARTEFYKWLFTARLFTLISPRALYRSIAFDIYFRAPLHAVLTTAQKEECELNRALHNSGLPYLSLMSRNTSEVKGETCADV